MKKNKYLILTMILFIISFMFISCKNKPLEIPKKSSTFNNNAATGVVDNYIKYLMKEDFEGVKSLYSEDMLKEQGKVKKEDVIVKGYRIEEATELGKSSIFKVKVMSVKKDIPYSSLEEYRVQVIKEKDGYKISEVKIIPQKEAFNQSHEIRIRDKNNVDTNLVLGLEHLPKTAFSQEDKLNVYKQRVPAKAFKSLGLSYDGMKVLVSSYDGDSYLGAVTIDESLAVQGNEAQKQGGGGEEAGGKASNRGSKEKPIGKEITSLDVIKGCYVDYMVFSQDEKYIVVQYTKNDNTKCIRVYEYDGGKMIPVKFEETFPIDKVNVQFSYFDKDNMVFQVVARKTLKNEEKDLVGTWKLSLKDFKIKRF